MRSFPGSVLLESTFCGSIDDTDDNSHSTSRDQDRLWKRVDQLGLCSAGDSFDGTHNTDQNSISSSTSPRGQNSLKSEETDDPEPSHPSSALFARALVSEVTDNPKTMTPAAMAEREKKLLRAQAAAKKTGQGNNRSAAGPRPVGAPGGIGQPNWLGSVAHAITGGTNGIEAKHAPTTPPAKVLPPNSLQENRAQQQYPPGSMNETYAPGTSDGGKYSVTIGLSLSRRSSVGHPDTVTRQTAFDFNELQDRQYKYVSSTDSSGWRAGGGERGGDQSQLASAVEDADAIMDDFGSAPLHPHGVPQQGKQQASPAAAAAAQPQRFHKVAAPDTVHIPIIQIDAESPQAVDAIISALARGEVFIPHMAVLPEALSVNGISPPDLVVRFGCERNDDVPPDEWPNWCLEFMHNQLYEYFYSMGAKWMKRPFSITLARKVRWKTVKHMNRYFAHAERVIDAWREKGPQYLDPQLSYIEGGATPEEVARPHGIYLLRNGIPTNYFAPNFDPPYTTKMTRSLLLNVLGKSWDKKRREWTAEPVPRLVTPSMLMAHMCGCADPNTGGFMASEVTSQGLSGNNNISDRRLVTVDQYQQQKNQQQQDGASSAITGTTSAITGPVPATPAVVFPASASGTPHSTTSTEDYHSQSSGSRNGKKKHQRQAQQHSAPHTHVQTFASVSPSTYDQAGASIPNHLKSPPKEPQNRYSSIAEEKKMDDDGRRARAEAPGKYLTFRSDGQSVEDPPPVPGSAGGHHLRKLDPGQSNEAAYSTTMHNKHKQTIQTNKQNQNLWKKKKGRGNDANPSGSPLAPATNRNNNLASSPRHASPGGHGLPNSDSGVSLEYSMDSSMFFGGDVGSASNQHKGQRDPRPQQRPVGGGSMMMQFAEANQAIRAKSHSGSSLSQRSGRRSMDQKPRQDEDEILSLQESGSSEVIPTDEELFVVGWAKALDPSSGNYYYFTLDRTKTVWENPLSTDTYVSGESSSVSGSVRQQQRQASK